MNLALTGIEELNALPHISGIMVFYLKWKWSKHVKRAGLSMTLHFPSTCKDTGLWHVTILQLVVELGLMAVSPC